MHLLSYVVDCFILQDYNLIQHVFFENIIN